MTNLSFDDVLKLNGTERIFTHHGIRCMVIMGPCSINGYIELGQDHPWVGLRDWNHPANVHGGLTFHEGNVIGFDTNHYMDAMHPESARIAEFKKRYGASDWMTDGHYWDWDEVIDETKRLAEQAAAAEGTRHNLNLRYRLESLTPDELEACRGMWCEDKRGALYILAGDVEGGLGYEESGGLYLTGFVDTRVPDIIEAPLADFTTRPDLLRAWGPDSKPIDSEVEEIVTAQHPRGSWNNNPENPEYFDVAPGTHMRRHVTRWEACDE